MTYLQLVNNVLRRLREDEVSSVTQTTYSKLVGDFVNDAKKLIESSWKWNNLRDEITLTTTLSDYTYTLTGGGKTPQIVNAINDTENTFMRYQTPTWFDNEFKNTDTPSTGSPEYYTFRGLDGDDSIIDVYPVPDGVYSLSFNIVKGVENLDADTDTLYIPDQPVIQLAYAMALRERGETGGQSGAEQFDVANIFLSDAIALDASKNPEELLWRVV